MVVSRNIQNLVGYVLRDTTTIPKQRTRPRLQLTTRKSPQQVPFSVHFSAGRFDTNLVDTYGLAKITRPGIEYVHSGF